MKRFWQIFLFSLLVTLSMNFLDSFFHLLTNTAVHLGYVVVKFTIIFLSVFFVSWFSGITFGNGLFTSLFGTTLFYVYYRMASATLDRTIFKLDENVGYILLHASMLLLVYMVIYHYVLGMKSGWSDKTVMMVIMAVSGVIGVLYLLVPYTLLHAAGIHLELSAEWLRYVGAVALIVGIVALIALFCTKRSASEGIPRDATFAFIVASGTALLDIGFYFVTQIGSAEFLEFKSVIFKDVGMVGIVGSLVFIGLFYATRWLGKSYMVGGAFSLILSLVILTYVLVTGWFTSAWAFFIFIPHVVFIFGMYEMTVLLERNPQ